MRFLYFLAYLGFTSVMYSQDFNYAITDIPEELLVSANSILRDEKILVNIPDEKTLEFTNYRVVTVMNKKGERALGAYVHYDNDIKVKSLNATVYNELGEEIASFKKGDFKDASAVSGGTLFSDSRVKYLDYTATSYPFTLVFESKSLTPDTGFIPGWQPTGRYHSSTEKSSYTIIHNGDLGLKYKAFNQNESITIEEQPNKLVVSTENFIALVQEDFSPNFREIVPRVIFGLDTFSLSGISGVANDWASFGTWMNTHLLQGVSEIPETTRIEIEKLVEGENDKIERAKKVYEYVQNKTRYISVQVGIGGWKPMLASDVDKLGYGDCKALTNYTKALLEIAEIPSYYTVLYGGRDKRDIQDDFVSLQGNHAILTIPDGDEYVWLECTSQDIPFGFIGDFTDDRDVVVVTPEGGKIVHTDVYNHASNRQQIKGSYKVLEGGAIEVNAHIISSGIQYDDRYTVAQKTEMEQKKYYYNFWSYINNVSLEEISIINNKNAVSIEEQVTFRAESYASFAGEEMLLAINALNRYSHIPMKYKDRKYSFEISRGFVDDDEVTIEIPDNYSFESIPEDISLTTDFGVYKMVFDKTNTGLSYKRHLTLKDGTFPKERYNEFRKFMKKISRFDNQKVILKKN
ncbi:DUF3857 domain-containing protein [Dokdonia sp. R86516]|uniref:DUF3857 domain-containing protein n=1 Tax=Dokdonia sp. R86516 TaxID=3093856 RepID=UPI0037C75EE9